MTSFRELGTPVCETPSATLTHGGNRESAYRQMIVEGKQLVRDGVHRGQRRLVEDARVLFDAATEVSALAPLAHYHTAYAEYRLARMKFQAPSSERLEHVRRAIEHLRRSVDADPDFSEAHALLAVCYGMEMAKRLYMSVFNGPAASIGMGKARGLSPTNPRVSLLYGFDLANKPAVLGGNQNAARRAYETAIELFAHWTNPSELHPDWGLAEAHAMVGISYYRSNEFHRARQAFERALTIAPDFALVKIIWLPRLEHSG